MTSGTHGGSCGSTERQWFGGIRLQAEDGLQEVKTLPAAHAWGTFAPRYCTGNVPGRLDIPAYSSGSR